MGLVAIGVGIACVGLGLYMGLSRLSDRGISVSIRVVEVAQPEEPADDSAIVMPESIIQFCNQESEPFAREELIREAERMYAEYGDWESVELALSKVG